ncbi:DUF2213 domain-containing protein [Achromobacter aloeverae]
MPMRFDRVPFKATRTDEGYIKDTPVLTRTGVFVYLDAAGRERREYRPPEEVFNADSMASLKGVPITDGHPGKVTASNARKHSIGTALSEARKDGVTDLVGDIVIHDPGPVDQAGKKELSLGYELQLDETPGVSPDGERYDAIQRNIRYNHLAVVKRGRAGNARLNLDAADAVTKTDEDDEPMNLVKIRLDSGLSYDAAPEVAQEIDRLRADAAAAKNKAAADLAEARAAADREKARADAAEDAKKKAEEAVADATNKARADALARVQLESAAKAHGVEIKQDMADKDIRVAVIKVIRGDSFDATGKSDAYIEAAYDYAVADKAARADALASQRREMQGRGGNGGGAGGGEGSRQDGADKGPVSAAAARTAMIAKQRNMQLGGK